jgi:hypothetical protein
MEERKLVWFAEEREQFLAIEHVDFLPISGEPALTQRILDALLVLNALHDTP